MWVLVVQTFPLNQKRNNADDEEESICRQQYIAVDIKFGKGGRQKINCECNKYKKRNQWQE
jgi:hypothetical protein